jgi:hypothetical protein
VYKIKTTNYAGESLYSEPLPITVGLVPNAPTNLRISSQTVPTVVSLAWNPETVIVDNPKTLAYKVYIDDLSGNPPKVVFDTTDNALVYETTVSGLTLGALYKATVTATNEIGESLSSSPLTIHVGILPSKIKNVRLDSSTTTSIFLRWDFPESNGGLALSEYTVYLDVGQTGVPTKTVTITDTLQNWLNVASLTTGVKVDVEISASNVNGEGEKSDSRTYYVATAPAQMAAPTETKITLPNYSKDEAAVQVSWVAPSNNGAPVYGYKLYMADGPREYSLIYDGVNRADILTFTATKNILKTQWYRFRVSAVNIIGESVLSAELTVFVAVVPSTPVNFTFVSSDTGSI